MIEELKHDDVIRKMGGRFKLTALIQKRWVELMRGARPMIENDGLSELETAIQEVLEGKVEPRIFEEGDEESESED